MAELIRVGSLSDVAPGDTLPTLESEIDTLQLVRYCGASGDYNRQHWDLDHMRAAGFPGVIVHGWLTFALMCRAATRVIPREVAEIADYTVRYLAPAYSGVMRCGGKVLEVREESSCAELILWARNEGEEALASARLNISFGS